MNHEVLQRLTGQARRALHAAHRAALANHDDYVGTEHLLLSLLEDAGALALLSACAVDGEDMRTKARQLLERTSPGVEATHVPFTPAAKRAVEAAAQEAEHLMGESAAIGGGHLLLGLCYEEESLACFLLSQFGVTRAALREQLRRLPTLENSDQAVQAIDGPTTTPLRADPTLEQVRTLFDTSLSAPHAPLADDDEAPVSVQPDLTRDELTVLQGLAYLPQVALGLALGTLVGAVWGTWKMVVCMAAGIGLGMLRSGWLGALGGAFAGYHLALRLCQDQTEALLVILVCIFAGSCLGDWPRRLAPPPRK